MLAITGVADEYAKARVVDLLLTGGAVISEKNSKGQTAEDLAINKRLPSVVTRLQWRSKDGPAAESADQLDQAVDALFLATVTTFKSEGDSLKGFVSERHDVSQLLLNQEYESTEEEEKQEAVSKWIHLPANNMRWVEVLISQLYKDKTQTYNILKPERWVRRQHHRGLDTSNATSMQQETELFDEFTAVMEVTKKEQKTKQSLKTQLNALSEVQTPEKARPQDTKQFQVNLTKRFEAVLKDLNDNSANQLIDFLVHSSGERITQEKVENLFKIAQLRVLDITKEVQLLHQIKDVQDELRIMSMIFRDQKVVIHEMEDIIQSIPSKGATEDPSESKWRKPTETIARELSEEDKTPDRAREKTPIQNVDGNTGVTKTSTNEEEDNVRVGNDELFSLANGVKSLVPEVTRNHIRHDAFFTSMAPKTGPSTSLDKKQRSAPSPRAIVQLSIDEIEDMIEGANNVYNAKQSNVMDARYARVQAEQSVKQGKTIMVFTIVTIVFLPLSFMAAFFAIDIHQFKRASDGKLSIGYVSEIMFPVSAFIIAFLIYIAFEIDSFESWWTKWTGKLPVVKKRKVGDVENPPSGNDNRRD
ncbi:hypothetical protein FPSE5266_06785 [Fusarium pseudograminearum]|nr:hypothetical protein FPSE5266_06785 [Fusarium pseudograminearum]